MPAVKTRLPEWMRRPIPTAPALGTHQILEQHQLNTVCESALCPNRTECYSRSTATFMILGNVCTRSCGFCAIEVGKPQHVMTDEPLRVAKAAKAMRLQYVVVTSVARDDLKDEGAGHFAQTIRAIRAEIPGVQIEVLTPDFHARRELIAEVTDAKPEVYNHNLETVERLQKKVRVQAEFQRSLKVLKTVKELDALIKTKSGLMLGLGEREDEIVAAACALREVGCNLLTLGQYLPPTQEHLAVAEFITPEYFKELGKKLKRLGFDEVFSGPYVRSSYHAGELFHDVNVTGSN